MLDRVTDRAQEQAPTEEVEVVDAVPVSEAREAQVPAPPAVSMPRSLVAGQPIAVQAAAVAVTGFAAGAATVAVVRRRRARKALGRRRRDVKALGEIRGSRSFLVDVHLLDRRS